MSDNDLIKRGDAEEARDEIVRVLNYINTSGTLDYADYCELFDTIERVFDALKAVPHEMTAREYIITEERCKSWCLSNSGCESCRYHEFCWADAIEPEEYLRFYTLWAKEHPERSEK